jgi:arginine decarboxylase
MSSSFVPKKLFFTHGVGHHREELRSFERALRDAEIEKYNLVHVSSILPPHCEIITPEEGIKHLDPGQIVFCVMARSSSNESHRLLASSIGCAVPADQDMYGYLSEHHTFGQTQEQAGDYAEDLAASMLATSMGLKFNDDDSWDEKEQHWKISGQIVKTHNETATAVVEERGFTTVVAAAILILE